MRIELAFAVLGAIGYGFASVLEAVGARGHKGSLQTLAHPAYLAGLGLDVLAWLASLVALRTLAVYQVQAVLAGSLAVTALAARLLLRHQLRRTDLAAIAVTMVALAAIAASAGPQPPVSLAASSAVLIALSAIPVALAGWLTTLGHRPGLTGAMAGLAFGGAAVCARALDLPAHPWTGPLAAAGAVASEPLAWSLLIFGVTGMLLYANALEHGRVGPVTALLWITEVLAPSVAGLVLLHDSVRPGWFPIAVVAVVAATVAAVVLASAAENMAGAEPRRPVIRSAPAG